MKNIRQDILESSAYSRFSGENEKIISDLINNIKNIINEIECSASNHETKLNELFSYIEINNAVLSHFKNSNGLDLILKLRAVIDKYKSNTTENSVLLNTADHLLSRLDKFQTKLFNIIDTDSISEISHSLEPDNIEPPAHQDLKYKWMTFERSNSLFIAEYNNIEIIDYDLSAGSDNEFIHFKDKKIPVHDLMKSPDGHFIAPRKIIIIDSGKKSFAADKTGREIQSSSNIIAQILQKLENTGNTYSGRVRLFGNSYLVIRND